MQACQIQVILVDIASAEGLASRTIAYAGTLSIDECFDRITCPQIQASTPVFTDTAEAEELIADELRHLFDDGTVHQKKRCTPDPSLLHATRLNPASSDKRATCLQQYLAFVDFRTASQRSPRWGAVFVESHPSGMASNNPLRSWCDDDAYRFTGYNSVGNCDSGLGSCE
jgi:hypothetical protein